MIKSRLVDIFGSTNVMDGPETLDRYSKDHSLEPARRPAYVVVAENSLQIQKLVVLANHERIPIVPRSSKEGFYGLTIPKQGGVVLDLSNMKQVFEIDPRNRRTRIQPGVTYPQLQKELKAYELMALNPLLPHPGKSVLSSHLERDPMLIPKFEYGDPLLVLEAILPNGEIFRTGSTLTTYGPDEQVSDLKGPWGPGLDFYRLFQGAQGTLGIVTWMSIKTEYLPKKQKIFYVPFKDLKDVVTPAYEIQRLMLGNECFLLNGLNFAAIVADDSADGFRKILGALPPWILVLCVSGMKRRPEEKMQYEEEALDNIGQKYSLRLSTSVPGINGREKRLEERLRESWPEDLPYWKLRMGGSFQDLTFHVTLDRLPKIHNVIMAEIQSQDIAGDRVGCYFQPLERGRACSCEYSFYHDIADRDLSDRVKAIRSKLGGILLQQGALISRPYGDLAQVVYKHTGYYLEALKKVKAIFDPNDILNPGRLYA